ncbi:IS110 family transposase [Ruminococcaceae bacterium OttesenSCG-928-D13]|nr:IS110 family transposase [Ruminococcaceae bacterium OttesenSCG-928-D13]
MNAVGIDISKGKCMVAVLRPLGEVVKEPFEVEHDYGALESLAYTLKGLEGETRAIMESTGRYYEPVAQVLHEIGVFVSVVNPGLIHDFGNNSLRRVKTDKKDALKIAKFGLDNWAALREYTPMEAVRQQLKNASRQLALYTKIKTGLKNNLIALLDMTWPGVNTLFNSPVRSDGREKWVDFAYTFWHADCVCLLTEAVFVEKYRKWCKRKGYNFSQYKAEDLYIESLGHFTTLPKNRSTRTLIHEAITALNSISRTAEVFRAEMQRLAELLPEYSVVMEMYGVGKSIGPQLMAEIGDVRRFAHRGALIAYAGVDPQPSQSGKYDRNSNPISRKGSSSIRKSLYQVMVTLLRKAPANEPIYQFIDRKRSEGKPYFVYMTAGANKFLRIYYARVKEHLSKLDESSTT